MASRAQDYEAPDVGCDGRGRTIGCDRRKLHEGILRILRTKPPGEVADSAGAQDAYLRQHGHGDWRPDMDTNPRVTCSSGGAAMSLIDGKSWWEEHQARARRLAADCLGTSVCEQLISRTLTVTSQLLSSSVATGAIATPPTFSSNPPSKVAPQPDGVAMLSFTRISG